MGLAIGFLGLLVDAGDGHGQLGSMKILPISDARAGDAATFRRVAFQSEAEIIRFAATRQLRATKIRGECLSLFEAFENEAYSAIRAGVVGGPHLKMLHALVLQPLGLFDSLIYSQAFSIPALSRGRILLALSFIADAAKARNPSAAFLKLANARDSLPTMPICGEQIFKYVRRVDDDTGNTSAISVREQATPSASLKRGKIIPERGSNNSSRRHEPL